MTDEMTDNTAKKAITPDFSKDHLTMLSGLLNSDGVAIPCKFAEIFADVKRIIALKLDDFEAAERLARDPTG